MFYQLFLFILFLNFYFECSNVCVRSLLLYATQKCIGIPFVNSSSESFLPNSRTKQKKKKQAKK